MNITILCVGKLKEKYWKDAVAEYAKRLSAYCRFDVVEVKEDKQDDIVKEGEALLSHIKDQDYVITLEILGKERSSEDLADHLQKLIDRGAGNGHILFVIGGSNGLSKAVMDRSNEALSFSPMTFPHQLMRVILAEQIYRSFKIMRGEKYHK